ncbi:MAG: hypothetical protein PHO37_01065 [Kiritimatiellae bacterium]|nr:hypothetical protein [Kiritimatiellia bacterium]
MTREWAGTQIWSAAPAVDDGGDDAGGRAPHGPNRPPTSSHNIVTDVAGRATALHCSMQGLLFGVVF